MSSHRPPARSVALPPGLSRRRFLRAAGAGVAGIVIAPRRALGARGQTPPGEKLNLGFIGAGGRAEANLAGLASQNVVALCDVDETRAAGARKAHPNARFFTDFRRMLDAVGDSLDGVVVSTPDHTHAICALAALRRDKHVYCEKPLAHSVGEVRALMRAARERKVVTQLGNQGHSSDAMRSLREWLTDGAIGNVHTVHAFCGSDYSRIEDLPRLRERPAVPATLQWDLWLGPARERPYHPAYLPGKWRGWMPFGCGVIGDWVCHVVDPVYWALDLGAPTTIRAEARNYDPKAHADTFPHGTIVTYGFPAKGARGPVKLVWFDGAERPPRPAELEADDKLPGIGALIFGDKGTILHGSHGADRVRLIPDARMEAYQKPAKSLPRVPGHYVDWLQAIRAGRPAGSDFSYGGPLTEIALLGVIATRLPGQTLEWDGAAMRFKNSAEANALVNPPARRGWEA